MPQTPRALMALSLGLIVSACAPFGPAAISPPGAMAPTVAAQAKGSLTVPVRLPALDARAVQFEYNKGYVNTLEVVLVDSLGVHQSFLVCRNPGSTGSPGGETAVVFQNVAPGQVTVTVRTTYKRFVGPGCRLVPDADSPVRFWLDGGEQVVVPVAGDADQPVLVFRSQDLVESGSPGPAPISLLAFHETNDGQSELSDVSSVVGGYGVGAATGSVSPGVSATVSIQVAPVPRFDASVLNMPARQADAGLSISFKALNLQPGDQVVVVRGDPPDTASDFFDLTQKGTYDVYPLKINGTTATFTPTRATGGQESYYYLSRGEMLSYLGGTATDNRLARINVHPGDVSSTTSTVRFGSDDQVVPLPLAPGETDTLYIVLRDKWGNAITDADFGVRRTYRYDWSAAVEPPADAPDHAAYLPGQTIGTVTAPSWDANLKLWTAAFTQGTVAPAFETKEASYSLTPTTNGKITGLDWIFDPVGTVTTGPQAYTLGVEPDPHYPDATVQPLWVSLHAGAGTDSVPIASASVELQSEGATLSIGASGDYGSFLPATMLKLGLASGSLLSTDDDGTSFTSVPGKRAIGDCDKVVFRIFQRLPGTNPSLITVLTAGRDPGTYRWRL